MTPAPTQRDALVALRTFLVSILPDGVPVVQGQVNRVAEPLLKDFVVFWPIWRTRLSTNLDGSADVRFTGSISGATLTVTDVNYGAILDGAILFGSGVTAATKIVEQLSGTVGGVGTYTVDPAQTLSARTLASGATTVQQNTELCVQIDVHGPNGGDNAQTISTLMRDAYAVESFAAQPSEVVPLYADDPKQLPFLNAEQQYEDRWVVEAMLQTNAVVSVPSQYSDSVEVAVVSVDASYPP